MALAQTNSTTWQDEKGNALSAVQVQAVYRACQDRMFSPSRASVAMTTPLYDEYSRLALSDPDFNVCMQSFGYSQAALANGAKRAPE